MLREILLEQVFLNATTTEFGILNLVNAIDNETVEQIVLKCHCIFDTGYLTDNFPVWALKQTNSDRQPSLAQKILSIINEVCGDLQEVHVAEQQIWH